MNKEQTNEVFNKMNKADLKEYKLSAALEEITGSQRCMLDSAKHMTNLNAVYGTQYNMYTTYCTACELYKNILKTDEEQNKQPIDSIRILRSLFVRIYSEITEVFSWINKREYDAIDFYIKLDREERNEEISEITNKAIDQLYNRYESIQENDSYEFFIDRMCLIVILKEIEAYFIYKIKEKMGKGEVRKYE